MLRKIGEKGTVKVDEAKDPKEYKTSEKREMGNKWKENKCMDNMSGTWQESIGRKHGSGCGRGTSRVDLQCTRTGVKN